MYDNCVVISNDSFLMHTLEPIFVSPCYSESLPAQNIMQGLHQSHLFLPGQGRLEKYLWTPQPFCPHKQLVVLRHVEHRL